MRAGVRCKAFIEQGATWGCLLSGGWSAVLCRGWGWVNNNNRHFYLVCLDIYVLKPSMSCMRVSLVILFENILYLVVEPQCLAAV